MAPVAILDIVPGSKREELVRKSLTAPGKCSDVMAVRAFSAQVPLHMVGLCGCLVICHVAVDTLHSKGFEPKRGGGLVAAVAIGHQMGSQEGEPSLPVDIRNITDDPGVGGVAPAAVIPHSLLVQVRMALVALRLRLGEYQGGVTLPAFDLCMLSNQGHIGSVVVI